MFDSNEVRKELARRYNTTFIDVCLKDGIKTYLFGGVIRDTLMGKDWKDADVRLCIPLPFEERDKRAEAVLQEAGITVKSKIPSPNFTVYRFVPDGSSSTMDIDMSVVSELDATPPDFTINSLLFDLGSNELMDAFGAVEDIGKKVIRTVGGPEVRFSSEPQMMFRAVKCACQFGFDIEPATLKAMQKLSDTTKATLKSIADKEWGGLTEWLLAQVFRGLKYDPPRFEKLWNDAGLVSAFIGFVSERLGRMPESFLLRKPVFKEDASYSYEDALSIFLGAVAREIDAKDPQAVFDGTVSLFGILSPKEFGDFVIDASKIAYRA